MSMDLAFEYLARAEKAEARVAELEKQLAVPGCGEGCAVAEKNRRDFEAALGVIFEDKKRLEAQLSEAQAKVRSLVQRMDEARAECNGLGCGDCRSCLRLRAERAEDSAASRLDTLRQVAQWCHGNHGAFPQRSCGLCKPVLAAIRKH